MKRHRHTPESAARAVRALFEDQIPKTWPEYFARPRFQLQAYKAMTLILEQCNGIDRAKGCVADKPVSYRQASLACQRVIPELYADYWEALRACAA